MDKLFHLTERQTRSICPENLTGGKGCGAMTPPDRHKRSQMRFGMYRWHIGGSIAFSHDLRVPLQTLDRRKLIGNPAAFLCDGIDASNRICPAARAGFRLQTKTTLSCVKAKEGVILYRHAKKRQKRCK